MGDASITPANGDYLVVVGNAYGEGTSAGTAWSDELAVVYNQCQIFKTPLEITGTLLEASLDRDIPHVNACGGHGKCSTCRIYLLEGVENCEKRNI